MEEFAKVVFWIAKSVECDFILKSYAKRPEHQPFYPIQQNIRPLPSESQGKPDSFDSSMF